MATCPLCSERSGKRYCPAKETLICAVCCGTKREIEIDCPSSCSYLIAGSTYEAEKRVPDAEVAARIQKYGDEFVEQFFTILDLLSATVLEERSQSPWLVDNDVIEVYKALSATMKTLSSGIYYETLPDLPVRLSLYRRLKTVLDGLMQPDPNIDRRSLKVSEASDVLEFLTIAAEVNSTIRPKSRRYLDMLSRMAGRSAAESSGLILP